MADIAMIERTFNAFLLPGQVTELRAPGAEGKKCVCEVHSDRATLIRRAAELDSRGASAVYFIPNPVQADLAGWKNSRITTAHILKRRWLLVDVDSIRPTNTSATDAELRASWKILECCRATLLALGLTVAVIGCSGNGWHLACPVDYLNDQKSHDLFKLILYGLQEHCGEILTNEEEAAVKAKQFLTPPRVKVDTSTHDAPRIWKLYGTTARKGANTPERPHRLAFLVETP